ncbi:hypothetical protein [Allokutzneria oryzae]|uniref:ATP-grasp domain-containing protein n=1 Tax=Allokutzneria oryzae TaxID=1378989 RepID=A0ABV6A6R4_9PSEU
MATTSSSDSVAQPRLLLLSSGVRDHDWACAQLGDDAWLLTCSGEETLLGAAIEDMELRWGRPDRVVPLDGRCIELAGHVRAALGLPAPATESAPALRDRREMHRRAVAAGLPTVQLLERGALEDWDFRTPVIAKPVAHDAPGTRRLTSSYDLADLDPAADMLFEEWVTAPVCHVDGIAVDGRIVAAQLFYYVGSGRVAVTGERALARLTAAASDVVAGLDLPDGAFHIELFDLPTNPMLLDVVVPRAVARTPAEAPESRSRAKTCVAARAPQRVRQTLVAEVKLVRRAFRLTAA